MIIVQVLGVIFALVSVLTLASIFINLPDPLGKWFGKKGEDKLFFLVNDRKIRGLIGFLLLPVPDRYQPTGARLIAAAVAALVSVGMLFYYS